MIQSGGTKLRYATLMGIKKAKTKELRKISATDLGQANAPAAVLAKITLPQKQKSTQIIPGSAKEAAATLVEKLKFEVRVL
jgi:electron transfer flavoprotein beta subunit